MTREPEGVADVEASLVEASSCKIIARIDWADMLDPLCRGREGPCLLNAKMWQMGANVLVQEDLPKSPKMLASPAATPEKAQELHPQFSQNTISKRMSDTEQPSFLWGASANQQGSRVTAA